MKKMREYVFHISQKDKPYCNVSLNAFSARDALNEFNVEWGDIIKGEFAINVCEYPIGKRDKS